MHPHILAERNARAQQRILEAARQLATLADLPEEVAALENARHRDPVIAALFQREAIANFLEALINRTSPEQDRGELPAGDPATVDENPFAGPEAPEPAPAISPNPFAEPQPAAQDAGATDAARKLAGEQNVDLAKITGTGASGRITVDDVRQHVEGKG